MKVTLDINNDAELRRHIKQAIKGQVTSIIREDIKDILREVLEKKVKSLEIKNVDYLIKNEIQNMIGNALPTSNFSPSFIRTTAREMIEAHLKNAFKQMNIVT